MSGIVEGNMVNGTSVRKRAPLHVENPPGEVSSNMCQYREFVQVLISKRLTWGPGNTHNTQHVLPAQLNANALRSTCLVFFLLGHVSSVNYLAFAFETDQKGNKDVTREYEIDCLTTI